MPANDHHEPGTGEESFIRADERRRIARELHDSTLQLLAVLQLRLHGLKQLEDSRAELLVHECQQTIEEIRDQIRTLSLD